MRITLLATSLAGLALVASPALSVPVLNPGNGHHYEFIEATVCWDAARTAAASLTHLSYPGHLATITSAAENSFITSTFGTSQPAYFAWIGGHEPADNGVWQWGAGPEIGVQYSQGSSATAPFNYENWGGIEPNDFAGNEDLCSMNLGATLSGIQPGEWADNPPCPGPSDPVVGYVVEYETPTVGVESAAWGSIKAIFR